MTHATTKSSRRLRMNTAFTAPPTTPRMRKLMSLLFVLLIAQKLPFSNNGSSSGGGGGGDRFQPPFVVTAFTLNPSTPPADIIEQQLAALRDGDISTVYKFASPGNKLQTGDVTNFSRMVRSGPYRYVPAAVQNPMAHERPDPETKSPDH